MSRVGNFTSSQVFRLCSFGKGVKTIDNVGTPFDTYVQEKVWESRTGKPINKEANAKSINWGNFMERWVFENKMGLEYMLISKERYTHPKFLFSGMPDILVDGVVGDIKNPYTLTSFCKLADAIIADDVHKLKEVSPDYYWQLVANSILTGTSEAILIIHMPYEDELEQIKQDVLNFDGDANKVAFINWASDDELPSIKRGMYYQDMYKFQFTVSDDDKIFLLGRIEKATKLLIEKLKK